MKRQLVTARADAAAAVLRTLWIYAFLGWLYVAAIAVFEPDRMAQPLTHWVGVPRLDTFGAACFGISFTAYVGISVVGRLAAGGQRG